MKVDSPCISKCQIDENTSYCLGCFRTMEEISCWTSYDNKEKMKIIKLISKRKK